VLFKKTNKGTLIKYTTIMRKILLSFMAIVMLGMNANAQIITKEEARTAAAKVMVEFKNALKVAYNDSKNFDDFIKNSTGPYNPQSTVTSEGRNMLKIAYDYLSNKTSDQRIIETYSGKEVAFAFKYLKENNALDNEGILFGISNVESTSVGGKGGPSVNFDTVPAHFNNNFRCCFFCLRCHLITLFGVKAADKIIDVVVDTIINLLNN
jgi:hypothetical protein